MGKSQLLVKRHGHMEEYDSRKVYASVYAAALNAHLEDEDAERLADEVQTAVDREVKQLDDITSDDIRDLIVEELGGPGNDVAYLYIHHLNIN